MSGPLVNLTVDGRAVAAPQGTNLIAAAALAGVVVPHYCYHPKLSIAGNCRMCLVEVGLPKRGPDKQLARGPDGQPVIAFMPKLQIGCNTAVAEGMVVLTQSPRVLKARTGVMEFLLLNHPLDCPICDQAGECRLQEFAADCGRGVSRSTEPKVRKPKRVALGPKIVLDVERCIMCSRCIRFMREVAGHDVLGFTQRGSHTELACAAGEFPDTNYDLNIVDLCPVGALTAADFRFQQRVWFLSVTRSVCPHCATGCNTLLWAREGVVYRQTPRDNDAVNSCWMCDQGRLDYAFINAPERLAAPRQRGQPADWAAALAAAAAALRGGAGQGGVAAIGSARATTEELFLFGQLARRLGATLTDCVPRQGPGDRLLLSADRNPNTQGAWLTGVAARPPGSRLGEIAAGVAAGRIRGLLVHGEDVAGTGLTAVLLAKLDWLVVVATHDSPLVRQATVALPGVTFAEKRGTFINGQGRLQRLNPAIPPVGEARPDWQVLMALLRALDPTWRSGTLDDIFARLTAELPVLAGLTLDGLGPQGVPLNLQPQPRT